MYHLQKKEQWLIADLCRLYIHSDHWSASLCVSVCPHNVSLISFTLCMASYMSVRLSSQRWLICTVLVLSAIVSVYATFSFFPKFAVFYFVGNWSKIARALGNRTDNQCWRRWIVLRKDDVSFLLFVNC